MKIIISPAKKMNTVSDMLEVRQQPKYLEETSTLLAFLKSCSFQELQEIWKCNEKIAQQNYKRIKTMDLEKNLTPAILAYEGIQYQYMAPQVMEEKALDYIEEHLRILSGFYGILRPFDGVVSYRLEMQSKLLSFTESSLYKFWGSKLYDELAEEEIILNLASKEYSKCIEKYVTNQQKFITCVFGEYVDGKVKEKGTYAKMARGEMVSYLAAKQAETLEDVKQFQGLGYQFQEELSSETELVFLKKK